MGSNLEEMIRKNREMFDNEIPPENHEEKFLFRLKMKFKEWVSIVPHLIKVAIATIVIFILSIIVWDNYIRKDRHEVTLKEKIVNIFKK